MAEILPNTSNDIGNRGCTNTTLTQFKGKPRQVLVNIEDAYRLVVMDGSTLGGKFKAASLDELNSVKNTANSALTKTLALQEALNSASTQASNAIPKAGNRGALAGYSSSATGTTVNATSGDSLYASANVTVANGATGQTWTKVVKLSAGTVTLGTNWSWVGGEAPVLKYPCLLVCHWNQDKGIAGILAGVA